MKNLLFEIENKLIEMDSSDEKFSEFHISDEFKNLLNEVGVNTDKIPDSVLFDLLAFDLCENYQGKDGGWGIFFGPKITFKSESGEESEYPSLSQITTNAIDHWKKRALQFNHPILSSRYNLLVWEFSKLLKIKNQQIIFARNAIDKIIEIEKRNCFSTEVGTFIKLEYALNLAVQINDIERVKRVAESIIEYEEQSAKDDLQGLWGHAFRLLSQKKIILSESQVSKILLDMEERLGRLVNSSKDEKNPWTTETASLFLAKYYRSIGKNEDVFRVLKCLQYVFDDACDKLVPLQSSSLKHKLHNYYTEFGFREEADTVNREIRELGSKTVENMQLFTQRFEISNDEMQSIMKQFSECDLETAYLRFIVYFIPQKSDIEKQLDYLSKEAPLTFMIKKQIMDRFGRPIAVVGSLDDDREGNVLNQMAQNMNFDSIFMKPAIDSIINRFSLTPEIMMNLFLKSPLFSERKHPFIEYGVAKYFEKDYVTCIHILIPQIEDMIRLLVELAGGTVLKASKNSECFTLKLIDELLRDVVFINTFSIDIALYLRVLLCDQRGWNIRNNLCHGLLEFSEFNRNIADRLIHVLMLLSLVEEKTE